jgi:hypothetical protein
MIAQSAATRGVGGVRDFAASFGLKGSTALIVSNLYTTLGQNERLNDRILSPDLERRPDHASGPSTTSSISEITMAAQDAATPDPLLTANLRFFRPDKEALAKSWLSDRPYRSAGRAKAISDAPRERPNMFGAKP